MSPPGRSLIPASLAFALTAPFVLSAQITLRVQVNPHPTRIPVTAGTGKIIPSPDAPVPGSEGTPPPHRKPQGTEP